MLELIQTLAIALLAVVIIYKIKPATPFKKQKAVILDSCALIDGRVLELARAGFLPDKLLVPQFVIAELQLLADGNDSHKRERARFGLEIVQQLQHDQAVDVQIARQSVQAKTTDEKLVKLAKKIDAELFTTDFNLNQVASIEGVKVLNINELSHAMRPVALPGEAFPVKIVQSGSNRDQGVGYLEDGTMIVVDNAKADIGKSVDVKVTRTHQTVAGKMIFAQKIQTAKPETKATKPKITKLNQKAPKKYSSQRPAYRQGQSSARANKSEQSLLDAINNQ
jgi:uncharacterized protein YacL